MSFNLNDVFKQILKQLCHYAHVINKLFHSSQKEFTIKNIIIGEMLEAHYYFFKLTLQ